MLIARCYHRVEVLYAEKLGSKRFINDTIRKRSEECAVGVCYAQRDDYFFVFSFLVIWLLGKAVYVGAGELSLPDGLITFIVQYDQPGNGAILFDFLPLSCQVCIQDTGIEEPLEY